MNHNKKKTWNFTCCFVRVWNVVFHIKERAQIECVWEESVERSMWWKLHNEELHNLYLSPNFTMMNKSRMIWWAAHEEIMWEKKIQSSGEKTWRKKTRLKNYT
jgi:hypothetical protein